MERQTRSTSNEQKISLERKFTDIWIQDIHSQKRAYKYEPQSQNYQALQQERDLRSKHARKITKKKMI